MEGGWCLPGPHQCHLRMISTVANAYNFGMTNHQPINYICVFSQALMRTDTALIQSQVRLRNRGLKEKREWFNGEVEM